jgi:hypothetical protein
MKGLTVFAWAIIAVVALGCLGFAGNEVVNSHLIPIGNEVFSVHVCYDSSNWFSSFGLVS